MTGDNGHPPYLLGHSPDELERLEQQSRFFDEETTETLIDAGLGAGMSVLDVGCGAGDVSIAAARIVGPTGRVVGIDTSAEAVALAAERFARHGLFWARSQVADAHAIEQQGFDATTGRFILMHLADPVGLLRHLRGVLKPGGIMAFLEMDISSASITPSMPLFEQGVQAIVDVYRASGSEPNMGSRLFTSFREAGLQPSLRGSVRVEGGPDADVYDFLARSVASLLPAIRANGIQAPNVEIDRYAAALKEEASRDNYSVAHPRLTAAWARR